MTAEVLTGEQRAALIFELRAAVQAPDKTRYQWRLKDQFDRTFLRALEDPAIADPFLEMLHGQMLPEGDDDELHAVA